MNFQKIENKKHKKNPGAGKNDQKFKKIKKKLKKLQIFF